MTCGCDAGACARPPAAVDAKWRRVLWFALMVNAAMFGVEVFAGLQGQSTALLADALDFAADAANYGLTLGALALAAPWPSRAAWVKGASLFGFGVFVLMRALWSAWVGADPQPLTMSAIGLLALAANGAVAVALYRWRSGDANRRSVWLCTRNDMLGNVAVLLAAAGVFGTGTRWPDLLVAAFMAALGVSAGWRVMRLARGELRQHAAQSSAPGLASGG